MRISDWSSDMCSSDLAAAGDGEQDRQGDLAFAEVVAGILADGGAVGGIVHRVVDQLEGDAEVMAVIVERLGLGGRAAGDDRADPAGGGEQRRGLRLEDRKSVV